MKILMFCPVFYPHIGGVEIHVKRVSEELIKMGNEVTIITRSDDKQLQEFERIGKINVYRFSPMNKLRLWSWLFKNRNLIQNADIIHCHDYDTFIAWYYPFRFLYFKKPVFVTYHGYEGYPLNKKTIRLRRLTEKLSRGNISVGDFIPKWYGTKANLVTYGGTDLAKIPSTISNNKAVFIGRLAVDTGIMDYLEMVKILKDKYSINLKLEICGDGVLKNNVAEFCKINKLDVVLHGFVSNPNDYLINSKYAFVSGYLAILDAMAAKKIVVSVYNNPLKKDYLYLHPKSGSMVIGESPKDLAKKINIIHIEKENNEKINKEYDWAKNQSWQNVAKLYLKLWKK